MYRSIGKAVTLKSSQRLIDMFADDLACLQCACLAAMQFWGHALACLCFSGKEAKSFQQYSFRSASASTPYDPKLPAPHAIVGFEELFHLQ
jgi:hypothetical protein